MDKEQVKHLTVGKEFKNRKELCEFIGEEYKNQSNCKAAQDKEWKQYFDFEKIDKTQRIRITEIFETKRENYSTKGGTLPKELTPAVLKCLKKNESITNNQIAKKIRLTRPEVIGFSKGTEGVYAFAKLMYQIRNDDYTHEISNEEFREIIESEEFKTYAPYIRRATNSYKSRISTAMQRLQKKNIIEYDEGYIVNYNKDYISWISNKVYEEKCNGTINLKQYLFGNEDINAISYCIEECERVCGAAWTEDDIRNAIVTYFSDFYQRPRMATKDEEKKTKAIRNKIAKQFGFANEGQLLKQSLWNYKRIDNFYKDVSKVMEQYNIVVYKGYYVYDINYSCTDFDCDNKDTLNAMFCQQEEKVFFKDIEYKRDENIKNAPCPNLQKVGFIREAQHKKELAHCFVTNYLQVTK